jgi:hypothetical protein
MADLIYPGESPQADIGLTRLPENVDFSMWQGDKQDFLIVMTNEDDTPIDLTDFTAEAVIRASFTAVETYDFECTIQGVDNNEIYIYMGSDITDTIPAGDYVWNLQITDSNGDVRTLLAGDVRVLAQVD